ncbi:prolyl 3-hydroxylase OGFOD1 [Aphidius gifuensis]|uniref:prolyl 3-hydroxylase OGFOD1 n=1 Tax=Aphidius gifuensis TaxID=684658 RepID=UPI001CDBC11F|nr:prolyl 3-hydroxylase OGFOD1 [Aphidius gifuensis]
MNRSMVGGEPRTKKFKRSVLSDHIYSNDYQDLLKKNWINSTSIQSNDLELIAEPFRVCKISNFIKSQDFMEELKNELSDIKSRRKSIDLYQFEQTCDLATIDTENIEQLRQTLLYDFKVWLENNTNITLNSTLSMSSSCYSDTDYLLCHDDNLVDRKIAFVLYLSQNWSIEDGGTLDLFDTDEFGMPRNVVKSILPEYNSLVFFEVTDNSYHQVAEVTSSEKSRWSINGWFHGSIRLSNRLPRPDLSLPTFEPCKSNEELNSWIMETYLCSGIMSGIRESMEKQSYNFLAHFLQAKVYEQICKDLLSDDIIWNKVGPADVRNYEVADDKTLPNTLKKFYHLFKSYEFFKLLKNYTELDLVPDGKNMKPKMTIELQRWSHGNYTLIADKNNDDDDANGIIGDIDIDDYNDDDDDDGGDDDDAVASVAVSTSDVVDANDNNDNNGEKMKMLLLRERNDSTSSNEKIEDEQIHIMIKNKKRKKKQDEQASCSNIEIQKNNNKRSPPLNPDSEDSEVSDIGDYLSGDSDQEDDTIQDDNYDVNNDIESQPEPGTLDVIMQFYTGRLTEEETIDYVDPKEPDGALIHIPPEDNHLCLVYKTNSTTRLQKYISHYCEGYFYNLICTYYE